MTAITLILTDAGLAALTNPAHTGTAALTISHIGLSQQHAGNVAAQQALTALPGELKRLATFGGEVLSPRTIHVFLRDESADAYSLRAFGLYASTGVLLAVVSSETPIMEKAPAATLLQAVDLAFARDIDAELVFGDTNFVNPPATTSRLGVVELATLAETVDGDRHDIAVTPRGLAQALLSWAQNFAARVHGHVIGDISGLSSALAGKADAGHKHAAGDVTSGTFNVARIPALAMDKITGLVAALAGKAETGHVHAAGDVTSGTFNVARIPALAMDKITGLVAALAGKAETGHVHAAGDVTSGTFNVARIPALAMDKITGLVAALAGKAETGHVHAAGDVTSGTFNVARIPALAMDKITGLVSALAAKAEAATTILMRGSLGGADLDTVLTPGGYRQTANANAQLQLNYPITNDGGSLLVVNPSSDTGYQTYHSRTTNRMWTRPFLSGAFYPWSEHWTSANFDPAGKANVSHTPVSLGNIPAGVDLDTFITPGIARQTVSANATLALHYPIANERGTLIVLNGFGANGTIGSQLYIGRTSARMWMRSYAEGVFTAWTECWTSGNFDPGSKADVGSTNVYAARQRISNSGGSNDRPGGVLLELSNFAPGIHFEDRSSGSLSCLLSLDNSILSIRADSDGDGSFSELSAEINLRNPTAPAGSNNLRLANTAFVRQEVNSAIEPLATTAAMNAADALKAPLASPALTGNPTAPTQAAGNSSTRIATTAFVRQEVNSAIEPLATTAAMNAADALKAPLASPALTGNPTAPTQAAGNNSTRIASTAFVRQEVNSAIEPLATTAAMNAADALKAPLASPALTGTPTAPTPAAGNNSTRLATTAFVQSALTSAVSAGAVSHFARATAPAGWLAANGAAVSRTTYADLFAAIGTTFGAGNGSTTFNLPDLRGEFVRGLDGGRGIDAGRTLGSAQASQNLAHTHEYMEIMGVDNTQAGAGIQGGWFAYGATTSSSGGAEARPRNIALLACIKF